MWGRHVHGGVNALRLAALVHLSNTIRTWPRALEAAESAQIHLGYKSQAAPMATHDCQQT